MGGAANATEEQVTDGPEAKPPLNGQKVNKEKYKPIETGLKRKQSRVVFTEKEVLRNSINSVSFNKPNSGNARKSPANSS